jgi:FG-GAP-like repeat
MFKQRALILTLIGLGAVALIPGRALANHRTGSLILPELIVVGDFNQDGNKDLAVNCTGFDNVAILFGDGKGGFTLGGHFSTDTLPKGLQVGDVNRDGLPDLVTCNNWGYDETVLLGDGRGNFHSAAPPTEVDGDGEPVRLLLLDVNKDSLLDLAVVAPEEDKLIIYFGNGRGNFPSPSDEINTQPNPFALASGDLNADGNVDIVIVNPAQSAGNSKLTILLGDGTGQFAASEMGVPDAPTSVQIADFNRDGEQDVIISGAQPGNTTGSFLATYLGDGTGKFILQQDIDLGMASTKGDIAVGDFNEDGNLDVAWPKTSLQIRGEMSTELLVFFGDGAGNLSAGPVLTVGQEPHTVVTADLNGDGHLDLADSNRTDGTVTCLLGDGQGNFTVSSTTSVLSPIE